jgi:hypothetical protein
MILVGFKTLSLIVAISRKRSTDYNALLTMAHKYSNAVTKFHEQSLIKDLLRISPV